jgi:hypothetical protein
MFKIIIKTGDKTNLVSAGALDHDLVLENDLAVIGHELDGELRTLRIGFRRQNQNVEGRQKGKAELQRLQLPDVQVGDLFLFLGNKEDLC